jgi:hypothetical protein
MAAAGKHNSGEVVRKIAGIVRIPFPLVIASEAKQSISPLVETWIASSLRSSQ